MVKIRLQRVGKKKAPFYHVVVADSRSPRDGKIVEKIGTYNPVTEPATIELDAEKVGKAGLELGIGRKRKEDPIDYRVGLIFNKKIGDKVEKEDKAGK